MTGQSSPAHPLDQAVALELAGDNLVRGRTVDAWANMVGPFGGTTAATMLQAILQHPERHGDPLALTLNYAGPVAEGEFEIEVRPTRTNRSNQHWWLEMRQGDQVVTTATAITALRRETWSETEAGPPEVPAPEDLSPAAADRGVRWVDNYDMRFVTGAWQSVEDGETSQDSTTTMWIRDTPPRTLDHVALTAMCDSFFPRSFLRLGRPVPAGTVTLTIHYLATADEIAAQGTDFILGSVHAHRFHGNYHDESARLWGRDGTLLATSHQLMYFKS
ncbi:acyl-CoA thioesterase [Dietzia psychralcaliphila]|uniref:acyl-CoA thioesterase n=1 Tax=Dietzia psychralcaliphila TaxID=139021 RepID=UPI001C1E855B|nr:thioesterase family protein [Dietzia psychralcaliphila]